MFYSRDARLSISSSPMIVWARNLFSCILQATSSKPLWYQAIFIVGIIHSQLPSSKFNMPILCAQSLRLPSSKFKMPILCTQSLRLPSSKFKGPILSTQSLRLPSSKSKRPILCTQSLRLPSSKFKRSILCTQSLRLPSSKFKRPKTRNGPPQKKAIWEDEIFEKQWLLSAQRTRKKAANIQIGRGSSGAPKARLFLFFDRFGGSGLADRCFRDRLSADLGLLCAAAAAGKQSLGSSFWPTWALTGAQRRRQTVFREQFLPTWALTGAQRRRQAVFREQFLPTWALTGARRRRQAVFRERFWPTWALTFRGRQAVFRDQFLAHPDT